MNSSFLSRKESILVKVLKYLLKIFSFTITIFVSLLMHLQEETAKTNSTNERECFILEKWFPKGLLLNEGRTSSTNEKERDFGFDSKYEKNKHRKILC